MLTFPVSGPGSAGMEMCFVNLVSPNDKVIVCRNGVFGNRMVENVERCGGKAIVIDDEWGKAVDVNKVADAFKENILMPKYWLLFMLKPQQAHYPTRIPLYVK
jgi:alanine-glyoxylate transaminase/serine-glyoxylate transaminase/serine-pyruvate transaminase